MPRYNVPLYREVITGERAYLTVEAATPQDAVLAASTLVTAHADDPSWEAPHGGFYYDDAFEPWEVDTGDLDDMEEVEG